MEKHITEIETSDREELILHAVRALRDTLSSNQTAEQIKDREPTELDTQNCAIGVVGKDEAFHVLTEEEVKHYLGLLDAAPAAAMAVDPQ